MINTKITCLTEKLFQKRFAYDHFGYSKTVKIGNIMSFVAPINIREGDSFLSSEQAINFCVELPSCTETEGVMFRRLFILNISQILSTNYLKCPVSVSGTDIVVEREFKHGGIIQQKGNVCVSRIYRRGETMMFFVSLHNKAGAGAKIQSYSLDFNSEVCDNIMNEINMSFYYLSNDIFITTSRDVIC